MTATETLKGNEWDLSCGYNIALKPANGYRELPPPQDASEKEAYFWLIHGIRRLYVNPNWWDFKALVATNGVSAGSLDLAFVFVNSLNDRLSKVPPDHEFLREGVLNEAAEQMSRFLSRNGRHRFNNWMLAEQPKGSTSSLTTYLEGTNRVPFLNPYARYHEVWDPRWPQWMNKISFLKKRRPRLYQTGVALIEMILDPIDHAIERTEALIRADQEYRRKGYNEGYTHLAANERRRVYLRSLRVANPVDLFE